MTTNRVGSAMLALLGLFPGDGQARKLRLVGTKTASTGVLICTYQPAG